MRTKKMQQGGMPPMNKMGQRKAMTNSAAKKRGDTFREPEHGGPSMPLAADVERLGECCRATFVDIYKSHDVLIDFRNDIISMLPESKKNEVPMPPKKGDLIIDQVLESEFFFS